MATGTTGGYGVVVQLGKERIDSILEFTFNPLPQAYHIDAAARFTLITPEARLGLDTGRSDTVFVDIVCNGIFVAPSSDPDRGVLLRPPAGSPPDSRLAIRLPFALTKTYSDAAGNQVLRTQDATHRLLTMAYHRHADVPPHLASQSSNAAGETASVHVETLDPEFWRQLDSIGVSFAQVNSTFNTIGASLAPSFSPRQEHFLRVVDFPIPVFGQDVDTNAEGSLPAPSLTDPLSLPSPSLGSASTAPPIVPPVYNILFENRVLDPRTGAGALVIALNTQYANRGRPERLETPSYSVGEHGISMSVFVDRNLLMPYLVNPANFFLTSPSNAVAPGLLFNPDGTQVLEARVDLGDITGTLYYSQIALTSDGIKFSGTVAVEKIPATCMSATEHDIIQAGLDSLMVEINAEFEFIIQLSVWGGTAATPGSPGSPSLLAFTESLSETIIAKYSPLGNLLLRPIIEGTQLATPGGLFLLVGFEHFIPQVMFPGLVQPEVTIYQGQTSTTTVAGSTPVSSPGCGGTPGGAVIPLPIPSEVSVYLGPPGLTYAEIDDLIVAGRPMAPTGDEPGMSRHRPVAEAADVLLLPGTGLDLDASGDRGVSLPQPGPGAVDLWLTKDGRVVVARGKQLPSQWYPFETVGLHTLERTNYESTVVRVAELPQMKPVPGGDPVLMDYALLVLVRTRRERYARCLLWRDPEGAVHARCTVFDSGRPVAWIEPTVTATARREAPRRQGVLGVQDPSREYVGRQIVLRVRSRNFSPMRYVWSVQGGSLAGEGTIEIGGMPATYRVDGGQCVITTAVGAAVKLGVRVTAMDAQHVAADATLALDLPALVQVQGTEAEEVERRLEAQRRQAAQLRSMSAAGITPWRPSAGTSSAAVRTVAAPQIAAALGARGNPDVGECGCSAEAKEVGRVSAVIDSTTQYWARLREG